MQTSKRKMFICVIYAFALWGGIGVLTGALLPDIMKTFLLTSAQAGVLISLWSISLVIGSWVSSRIIERVTLNTILIGSSAVSILALVLLFLSTALWQFFPAFVAIGAMMGMSVTIGHTIIGIGFPERRTSMLSALDVVFTMGSITAPLGVLAINAGGLNWQFLYLFLGLGFVLLIAILLSYLPIIPAQEGAAKEKNSTFSKYFSSSFLVLLGFTGVFLGTVEWAQNSWLVSYALGVGMTESNAQLGLAVYLAGMLVIRILTIFLSSWMLKSWNLVYLLGVGLLGNLILLYGSGITVLILGNFFIGLGIGGIFPIALGSAMDFEPKRAATSSAVFLMGMTFGSQIATLFLGWLADHLESISQAFQATTLFFVLLILFYIAFQLKIRRSN